jgi:glycosyltransferase involved in cell wall biosynthesis
MRVLHLNSLYPPQAFGGAEKVVEVLAEGSAARGLTVGVAHLVREPAPSLRRNGVDVHPLHHRNPLWIETSARHSGPVRKLNKIATLFNVLTAADFGRLLDEYRPDLVHTHSMSDLTPLMWKSAHDRGLPLIHTLHDYDLLCIRGTLHKDGRQCVPRHWSCSAFSEVKRRHHRHIRSVVGVSDSILQTHLDHGFFAHLPADRRRTIWNPLRAPSPVAARAPRAPAAPLVFGFLGRLVEEKGIAVLLQACRLLPAHGWSLRVAGRAPTDGHELVAASAGLPVHFEGYVDAANFLATVDVLVVPSIWLEPFGLTIFEAYMAGLRVIGSDIAGVAEILGQVDPAALFAADDPAALAAKMRALLASPDALAVPAAALQAALARVRPEAVVEQYLQVYDALLRSPGQGPAETPAGLQ